MPCYTQRKPNQTLTERKAEVREAIASLSKALIAGSAKLAIGPTGAPLFTGTDDLAKGRVTDNCAYRLIMATGSVLAKAKLQASIALSGKSVNKQAVAHGHHSHDGGATWHMHKG
jgi:hypothetical protein